MLPSYTIFTWRPLESALIIQQMSAFVLLLQFISSPSLLLFRNEEGKGRGEAKKKQESISGKCIHLSIKSEQEAFKKRGRLESEDHLL